MAVLDRPTSPRKLAAILSADIAGYSAMMGADEEGTVRKLRQVREAVLPIIERFGGRIVDLAGDGILAEFPSAVRAVESAAAVQSCMAGLNTQSGPPMLFRIGVNVGDVIHEGDRLYGDGINVAARLQAVAEAGGICISNKVHEEVRDRVKLAFRDMGDQELKNIARPVRVYYVEKDEAGISQERSDGRRYGGQETSDRTPNAAFTPSGDRGGPSIAVLPFQNATGDPAQDYLAEGIVDEISTALSKIRWLFVIGAASAAKYGGRSPDLNAIKQALRVGYILQGSVRRSNQRLRIAAQLVEIASARQLWADRFEGAEEDIFGLQDQVTAKVISAIEPSVHLSEIARSKQRPPAALSAYDHFLRAIPPLRVPSPESYGQAEEHLRSAVTIDPDYSTALAFLADCLVRQVLMGTKPYESSGVEALELTNRAITADPEDGIAFASASWVSMFVGRHAAAIEYADKALQLHPNSAYVQTHVGFAFSQSGETERARECFHKALKFNPFEARRYFPLQGIGFTYFFERKYEEALVWFQRAIDEAPFAPLTLRFRAGALAHLGRHVEAREAVQALYRLHSAPTLAQLEARTRAFRYDWMKDLYIEGLRLAGYE
jgi:adenylate cyclase